MLKVVASGELESEMGVSKARNQFVCLFYYCNANLVMPLKVIQSFTNSTFNISNQVVYSMKIGVIIHYVISIQGVSSNH